MFPKFCPETAGVKFWFSIGVGKKQSSLPHCFCVPIIRNPVVSAFNFNLQCQSCSGKYHGDNPWAGLRSNLYQGWPRKGKSMYHLHIGGNPSYEF